MALPSMNTQESGSYWSNAQIWGTLAYCSGMLSLPATAMIIAEAIKPFSATRVPYPRRRRNKQLIWTALFGSFFLFTIFKLCTIDLAAPAWGPEVRSVGMDSSMTIQMDENRACSYRLWGLVAVFGGLVSFPTTVGLLVEVMRPIPEKKVPHPKRRHGILLAIEAVSVTALILGLCKLSKPMDIHAPRWRYVKPPTAFPPFESVWTSSERYRHYYQHRNPLQPFGHDLRSNTEISREGKIMGLVVIGIITFYVLSFVYMIWQGDDDINEDQMDEQESNHSASEDEDEKFDLEAGPSYGTMNTE